MTKTKIKQKKKKSVKRKTKAWHEQKEVKHTPKQVEGV